MTKFKVYYTINHPTTGSPVERSRTFRARDADEAKDRTVAKVGALGPRHVYALEVK